VTEKIRPVVCKKCSTKHEVIEINGAYPILNCKKCGVVLFYDSGKDGIQANSNTTRIFVSEEFFQEWKARKGTKKEREETKHFLLDGE
jgi:uncharacterized Zn finger protein